MKIKQQLPSRYHSHPGRVIHRESPSNENPGLLTVELYARSGGPFHGSQLLKSLSQFGKMLKEDALRSNVCRKARYSDHAGVAARLSFTVQLKTGGKNLRVFSALYHWF